MNLLLPLVLLMKMVSNYSKTRYQYHVCFLVQHKSIAIVPLFPGRNIFVVA